MDNDGLQELCTSLLKADSEDEVINILTEAGYWNNPPAWRLYGDKEGNYSIAGSQQAEPEAALVEKLINSVDASLAGKCLLKGINPESEEAPNSMQQAVARFYENKDEESKTGGVIKEWSKTKLREVANAITLAATGRKKAPCLTIVDQGEGQTPDRIPDTILSLNKKNKQRIRFVQGKFNMGGTGVLRHCHDHSIQLIISKRNPQIAEKWDKDDKSVGEWGFTVVRRERPTGEAGAVINSEFKYLAPLTSGKGDVLRFGADSLPLMPVENNPYCREIEWGTLIKLYNYDLSAGSSNILMRDGLIYRLEALLPEIALPVRLHECRDFKGKKGSFDTNLAGLTVRLEQGKGDNLEVEPWDVPFSVSGLNFKARIYVFKKGKARTYLRNQGIIFSINGQTHGYIPKNIFGRNRVGLTRIGKDLLVLVDCSKISVDAREDLFMSSRDRLSKGELRTAIERQLEEIVSKDTLLRELQENRRAKEQSDKLADEKPLEDILNNILKSSPSLSALFLQGQRLSMPKKHGIAQLTTVAGGENGVVSTGPNDGKNEFVGKKHPTYFRFQKAPQVDFYKRNCEQGRMVRVAFETDVENGYFTRPNNPGSYGLEIISGNITSKEIAHSADLHNGIIQWSVNLSKGVVIGDKIVIKLLINDDVILEPWTKTLELTVKPKTEHPSVPHKPRERKGGGEGDKETIAPSGMSLPKYIKVREGDDNWKDHEFDNKSGAAVVRDMCDSSGDKKEYTSTFYINLDNVYLQNEIKNSKAPALEEAKYVYGTILVGLSLVHDHENMPVKMNDNGEDSNNEMVIESDVLKVTRALSPFLLPMINYLGGLSVDDAASLALFGDEE